MNTFATENIILLFLFGTFIIQNNKLFYIIQNKNIYIN